MLLLFGPKANCFGRQSRNSTYITVQNEDANFPKSNLVDTYPDTVFRESAVTTDQRLYSDLSLPYNYDMEINAAGKPDGWTERTSGGSMTRTTTAGEFDTGAAAMEVTGGSSFAEGYQQILVKPGEVLHYEIRCRVVTAGTARFRIRNIQTGRYLNSSNAWVNSTVDAATRTGTTFGTLSADFTVESYAAVGTPECLLEIICRHDNATGSACFDGVRVWPHINFCAVFGHNIGSAITPFVQTATGIAAPGSWTTDTGFGNPMVPRYPGFFGYRSAGAISTQWIALFLTANPAQIQYVGELIFGYARAPARGALWGFQTPYRHAATRLSSALGRTMAVKYGIEPSQGLRLSFRLGNDGQGREISDEVWGSCGGGAEPIIVVPVDTEVGVYHGRVMASLDPTRQFLTSVQVPLDIEGSALPIVGL